MVMPMIAFALTLIVMGGPASLVVAADAKHARLSLYVGPIALFAGLGALILSMGLAMFCQEVLESSPLSGIGFFGGYAAGIISGAALGLRQTHSIRRRIESQKQL